MANMAYRDTKCAGCGDTIPQDTNIYFGPENEKLCPGCGEEEQVVCPDCGGQKRPKYKECWQCGRDKAEGVPTGPTSKAGKAVAKKKSGKSGDRTIKVSRRSS